jgi:hypothetical protein
MAVLHCGIAAIVLLAAHVLGFRVIGEVQAAAVVFVFVVAPHYKCFNTTPRHAVCTAAGPPRCMLEKWWPIRTVCAVPLLTCLLLLLPAELLDLRQKFEEGRKRLAALKAARNFRPS